MREDLDSKDWIVLHRICDRTLFCSIIGLPEGLGEMFKVFKKMTAVLILILILLHLIPMDIILITGMVVLALLAGVFLLFHLGVQDFQGY